MNSKIERYLIKFIEFIVLNDNFYRNTIILVFLIFNLDIYNIINNNIKNKFLFSYACIIDVNKNSFYLHRWHVYIMNT